jgi:hypothetical protein
MNRKQAIAIEIALQTHVLRTCPIHGEIYCDDEVDPSGAFALAVELVKEHIPYVTEFRHDAHELTDLLSETISAAPDCCPHCAGAPGGAVLGAPTAGEAPAIRLI